MSEDDTVDLSDPAVWRVIFCRLVQFTLMDRGMCRLAAFEVASANAKPDQLLQLGLARQPYDWFNHDPRVYAAATLRLLLAETVEETPARIGGESPMSRGGGVSSAGADRNGLE